MKGIDIYPVAISLTGSPKTGEKYLFWKSNDDGGNQQMQELSNDAKLALGRAYDIIASHESELAPEFVAEFKKAIDSKQEVKVDLEAIAKDNTVSPQVLEIVKDLQTKLTTVSEKLDASETKNREIEKATIKKSYEAVAAELDLLPVDKTEVSDLLFTLKTEHGDSISGKVEEVLRKCHESIKASMPVKTEGADSGSDEVIVGSAQSYVAAVEAEIAKDNTSPTPQLKAVKAMGIVKSKDPDGYAAYNEAVKTGQMKNIV